MSARCGSEKKDLIFSGVLRSIAPCFLCDFIELAGAVRNNTGDVIILDILPDSLIGIQVWRVAWQEEKLDPV